MGPVQPDLRPGGWLTFAVADYPPCPPSTLAQGACPGRPAPTWSTSCLRTWVDIHYGLVGGAQKIALPLLGVRPCVPEGRWGSREVGRIQMLGPGLVEVWEVQKGREWQGPSGCCCGIFRAR